MHITWAGDHIPGSPFKLKVHPGPNAGVVKAYGPGLGPSFEVGEVGEFTIETKNAGIGTLSI
jgi:filamin